MALLQEDIKNIEQLMRGDKVQWTSIEDFIVSLKTNNLVNATNGTAGLSGLGLAKITTGGTSAVLHGISSFLLYTSLIGVAIGGASAGYYGYYVYKDKKNFIDDVEKLQDRCEGSIWSCIKRESKKLDENPWNFVKYDENHEMFNAYKTLHDELFCLNELEKRQEYQKYLQKREEYVIPEDVEMFEYKMHLLYACNKFLNVNKKHHGEFQYSKPSYWSPERARRETLKKEIQKLLNKDCTFQELRDKYYASWKANKYLEVAIHDGKYKREDVLDEIAQIIKPYNDYEEKAFPKDEATKNHIRKLFLEYRYLGSACEFDYELILTLKLIKKYCDLNSYSHNVLNDSKTAKIHYGGVTMINLLLTGFFAGMAGSVALTTYNNELIKQMIGDGAGGVANQCANGSIVACEKMAQVNEYLSAQGSNQLVGCGAQCYETRFVNSGYGNPSSIISYIANNATADQVPELIEIAGKGSWLADGIVAKIA